MINSKLISRLLIIAYIILSINSYTAWIKWNPFASSLTTTFIQNVIVFIIILYPTFKFRHIYNNFKIKQFRLFNLFFIYTIGLSVYSLLVNTSGIEKQDFASLWFYIQAMLTCVLVYTFILPYWFYKIFRIILKSIPWLLAFLIPIANPENLGGLFGFILRPIIFILIFITILNKKNKFFYLSLTLISIVLSFINDARSNLIIPLVCLCIGLTINKKVISSIYKSAALCFIISPFILAYLGIIGSFNVFETDKYIKNRSVDEGTISDTRTLVYAEVLSSAEKNDNIIWGRGIGRGYESLFQESITRDNNFSSKLGATERHSEVGIHNIFTWGGIIYLFIYTIMFGSVIYFGLYKSNNKYIPAMALYIAFYYFYSWIENFQSFSIIFISSWFIIALCISPYFRGMNNVEFKQYLYKLLN